MAEALTDSGKLKCAEEDLIIEATIFKSRSVKTAAELITGKVEMQDNSPKNWDRDTKRKIFTVSRISNTLCLPPEMLRIGRIHSSPHELFTVLRASPNCDVDDNQLEICGANEDSAPIHELSCEIGTTVIFSAKCNVGPLPPNTLSTDKDSNASLHDLSDVGVNLTPDTNIVPIHNLPYEVGSHFTSDNKCSLYQYDFLGNDKECVTIHDLPCEVLEYIFSFLDIPKRIAIEAVCKYWRWLGKTRLWSWPRELTLKEGSGSSTPSTLFSEAISDEVLLALLSRCGRCLRKLSLWQSKYSFWDSEKTVWIVGEYCPNLVEITLYGIPVSYQCRLEMMAVGCPNLKAMKIHQYWDICDEDIVELLKGCGVLESLQVSSGRSGNGVTGECFCVINESFKILRLYRCTYLSEPGLEQLMARCNSLQDLRLTQCVKVNQETLIKVCHHYKKTLKILFLEEYYDPINWCDALRVLRNLEKLSISESSHVNDDVCRCLAKNCQKLRVLNISSTNVTDVGLTHLVSLPHLVQLDVACLTIQGYGLEILAKQRRLQKVYAKFLTELTYADQTFALLASSCPNLNTVDVSGVEEISIQLVETLCEFIKSGSLIGPVRLGVEFTSVPEGIETCNGLELVFEQVRDLYDDDYEFVEEDEDDYDNSYYSDEDEYDFYDDY